MAPSRVIFYPAPSPNSVEPFPRGHCSDRAKDESRDHLPSSSPFLLPVVAGGSEFQVGPGRRLANRFGFVHTFGWFIAAF